MATLEEKRGEIEELCRQYNDKYQASESGAIRECAALNEKIVDAVKEYTAIARKRCFEECKDSDNIMLTAIKKFYYDSIDVKDEIPEGSTLKVKSVVPTKKKIDILRLDKYCGGIGHSKDWKYWVERLNFELTLRAAREYGIKGDGFLRIQDSYLMSEIAKDTIKFMNQDKEGVAKPMADPVGNTTILKTLNQVLTAMLGEGYNARTQDAKYMIQAQKKDVCKMTDDGILIGVKCLPLRNFCSVMANTCYQIIEKREYYFGYKDKNKT